jgi:transcriptional regulator with XRE-family HTH domain
VGREIRYLRKHVGLSAKAFAGYLGVNPVSLSRIENGERGVTSTVDRLVRLLHAQMLAVKEHCSSFRNLLPLFKALNQGTLPLTEHRIEHLDAIPSRATGNSEWRELRF